MAATYRTANGKLVDIDALRLANEGVIAVGNMRTNARGDELGAGGAIVKTRAQLMQEYHKLNTPVINHDVAEPQLPEVIPVAPANTSKLKTSTVDAPIVADDTTAPGYVKPRGSFADAVAKTTEVKQELLNPQPGVTPGVKRI
jgi:hypothetical protein